MSEYIIGDRIEPSAQPYTLTEREFTEAVGIRVYGTEGGTGGGYAYGKYYVVFQPEDTRELLQNYGVLIGDAPIYTGYVDRSELVIDPSDPTRNYPISEALTALSTDPNTPALSIGKFDGQTKYPFSFIYEGGTHMTTVTERIAKITVSGSETVKFNPVYPVIAIKGDNIDATLIKDIAADATEGVYSTSDGDGYTIIDNHTCKDTLYLSGTGDVRIWGGTDANKCPFTSDITGGEEQPWQPLQDGYSNFWFELTSDTLSPWLNFSAKTENAVIDWGDGSGETTLDTLTPTHTYSKAGKYVVKVKGVTAIFQQRVSPDTTSDTSLDTYLSVLKAVELNSDVTLVRANAFGYMVGLERVVLPSSVSDMGSGGALNNCSMLKEIDLSATALTSISASFAQNDYSLKKIILNNSITSIGTNAFSTCISLRKVILPSTLESMGTNVFYSCYSLSEVHVQATTPPTMNNNCFTNLPSDWLCYVPVGTLSAYQTAWSAYADHILEEGTRMSASQLRKIQNEIKMEGEEKI